MFAPARTAVTMSGGEPEMISAEPPTSACISFTGSWKYVYSTSSAWSRKRPFWSAIQAVM